MKRCLLFFNRSRPQMCWRKRRNYPYIVCKSFLKVLQVKNIRKFTVENGRNNLFFLKKVQNRTWIGNAKFRTVTIWNALMYKPFRCTHGLVYHFKHQMANIDIYCPEGATWARQSLSPQGPTCNETQFGLGLIWLDPRAELWNPSWIWAKLGPKHPCSTWWSFTPHGPHVLK